jgi:hypothetical protein
MQTTLNAAPQLLSLTPTSATNAAGAYQTFTATYRDQNGASDFAFAYLRVNDFVPNMIDCLYDAVNNKLFVRSGDGATLLGGFAPGSANVISNGHGSLDCSQTTVSGSGIQLTINWRIACAQPLTGPNVLYLRARDKAGLDTSYQRMSSGTWTITGNRAPTAAATAPLAISTPVGVAESFSVTYTDADGWENMSNVYLRMNADLPWMLDAVYNVPSNRLYLRNSTTGALVGGFTPGSANVITNNSGSLNCAAITVSHSGTQLTVNWNLTANQALAGTNRVFVRARDAANGDSLYQEYPGAVWTVTPNAAPTIVSVSPAAPTNPVGGFRTFFGTYDDANGFANLNFLYLSINANDPAKRLQAVYNLLTNKLFLLADDGVTQLGGFGPGSNNVISNSHGSLNCAATILSVSGTRMTITWNVSATSTLVGTNSVWMRARDRGGLDTGFQQMPGASWTVTA